MILGVALGFGLIVLGVFWIGSGNILESFGMSWKDVFFSQPLPPEPVSQEVVPAQPQKSFSEMTDAELKARGIRVVPKKKGSR